MWSARLSLDASSTCCLWPGQVAYSPYHFPLMSVHFCIFQLWAVIDNALKYSFLVDIFPHFRYYPGAGLIVRGREDHF